ncbi:MFS transporter [Phytomonospora endophytica]|uniref:MFS family permease n=1 Tax=Phytomonospora endophytica TaxID=714109 RepID=A0A841FCK6_9ACTN|nr:MFS transporter [Phytomonospora endophytica]MBB6033996.1 MFS family permease [Phytomonospora endophytica]GIG64483.1 MFS transporter [Phytomonospora endophytica]
MTQPHTPTTETAAPPRWAPVFALALAMVVVTSDLMLAAVALPSIGTDLSVGPAATAWVLLGYALPMSAAAIPAGRWADRADIRKVFLLSMFGVGAASVLVAVAPTFWFLIAARFVQGLAGSLVLSVYMPIVAAAVSPDRRGRAIGYIITVMTIGSMVGAPLGGLAVGAFGWRGLFLLKLPVVAAALWLGWRAIPGNGKGLPVPDRVLIRDAVVMGGAVAAILLAFDRISEQPVLSAVLGAVAVVLAAGWLRLRSSAPLVAVVRRRTIGMALLGLFLMSFSIGLISFLLPYFVVDEMRLSPAMTGVALLFLSGAMAPVAPIAGKLADTFGAYKVAVAGAVVSVATLATMLTIDADSGLFGLIWRLVLIGIGSALFNGPINTALMAATPADAIGSAGGAFATVRTLASTVGPAVTALAWTVGGGGMTGFTIGVTTLVVVYVAGTVALLAASPSRGKTRTA